MVVDHDLESGRQTTATLEGEGYIVRRAESGIAALKMMREEPVDLVLADMTMPGMDGMQFLANVKEMHPDTDVIVLTGYGTIEDAVEAMRRGAADFLPRPYRPRELTRLTASVLRARSASREEAFQAQSAALLELAYILARTADIHSLPAQAVELARESFDADSAIILTYEEALSRVTVLAHAGRMLASWGKSEDLSAQAMESIRQRRLLLSAEVGSSNCYAYVPLIVADRPRGALCLRRDGGPWFHEKTTELLEIFSSHLALSLETTHLYHQASQQVAEMEELITVSHELALDADSESICQQLLAGAGRITGAQTCAVVLWKDGHPIMRTSPELQPGSLVEQAIRDTMLSVSGQAAPSSRASVAMPHEARRMAQSFLSAPIQLTDHTYGLLAVFSDSPNAFGVDDTRRLTALASHAASGMANVSALERVSAMYFDTIESISTLVDATNEYTLGHSRQVRTYAGALARALGLPQDEICLIEDGALLHDIGKLCIPQSILSKPGPLTAEEFAIVASHPAHGANMFKDAPHMQEVLPILRHHHEFWDGSGYPDGIAGTAIPVGARIVALADMLDALVSNRIYRSALSFDQARGMIAERAGGQFDPEQAKVFLEIDLESLVEY
jgi:putative nucleotidyltransferase with HDIG domain